MLKILSLLSPLSAITGALSEAYRDKLRAANNDERIASEERISSLEAQRDVLLNKQKSSVFWTIWAAFAIPVVIFFWKIVVWDVVLGLGVTDPLRGQAAEWAGAVVNSLFISGGGVAAITGIASAIRRRSR